MIVGVTPGGICSYMSDVHGGAVSDRQITESTNLITKINPGDSLMPDNDLDVQDISTPVDVTVSIPIFKENNKRSRETNFARQKNI